MPPLKKTASDALIVEAERAREAVYFARRVGITKEEAIELLKKGAPTMGIQTTSVKPKPQSGVEDPDVRYLAEHTDLSPRQAKELIAKYGRDRKRLLELAATMKAEG
jgi:hypothetical protein